MSVLPKEAVVFGTGGGSLTVAAELEMLGTKVILSDVKAFEENLKAVEKAGGIEISIDDSPFKIVPVHEVSHDPQSAVEKADLIVISVPCFGHEPFAKVMAPVLQDGQTVIWTGEGGGAFTTISELRKVNRKPKVVVADTNSLPYGPARVQKPGVVKAIRKKGGTYIAAMPTEATAQVAEIAAMFWPIIKPAANVWETLLVNFNAIDHVATFVTNMGAVENRRDIMKFWGEGLSPGVARIIGGVDDELAALRRALGLTVDKQYKHYHVEQGIVDRVFPTIYETMRKGTIVFADFQCGPDVLKHRYITEDVPYALVLASSLGDDLGVPTPVIDSLVTLASTASEVDFWTAGRTLKTWGLDGKGSDGLNNAVDQGWW